MGMDAHFATLCPIDTIRRMMETGGMNSPYMKQLTKWIQQSKMRLVDILRNVRIGVLAETSGTQEPDYDDKLKAPFYFNGQ